MCFLRMSGLGSSLISPAITAFRSSSLSAGQLVPCNLDQIIAEPGNRQCPFVDSAGAYFCSGLAGNKGPLLSRQLPATQQDQIIAAAVSVEAGSFHHARLN